MRGYLPASLLVELERRTGKPCCELFDLIAGTSIGGILAALLAAGVPAAETLKFFTEDGPKIFRRRWWRYFGMLGPRYTAEAIEEVLTRRFDTLEVKTHLLIPAFDLKDHTPYFFKFAPFQNHEVPLWQAARATSSAQIYFPAFRTFLPSGEHVFWDGGNVANNPAVCAYAEAVRRWGSRGVQMLSLGCGSQGRAKESERRARARSLVNAGALENGLATLTTLFEADGEEVDYQMNQFLGRNYHRVQPVLLQSLPLDDASPDGLLNLQDAAANALRQCGHQLDFFKP